MNAPESAHHDTMLEQAKLFVKMIFKPQAAILELSRPKLLALSCVIFFLNIYADPAKWQAYRNGVPTIGSQFFDALLFFLACLVLSPLALFMLGGLLKLLLALFRKPLSLFKIVNLVGYAHSLQAGIFVLLYVAYFSLPQDMRVFVKSYDWGHKFSQTLGIYTAFINVYIIYLIAYGLFKIPGENENAAQAPLSSPSGTKEGEGKQ